MLLASLFGFSFSVLFVMMVMIGRSFSIEYIYHLNIFKETAMIIFSIRALKVILMFGRVNWIPTLRTVLTVESPSCPGQNL